MMLWQRQYERQGSRLKYKLELIDTNLFPGVKMNTRMNAVHFLLRLKWE